MHGKPDACTERTEGAPWIKLILEAQIVPMLGIGDFADRVLGCGGVWKRVSWASPVSGETNCK